MTARQAQPGFALLFTLSMAQFMVVLDFTIVNVALPSIQHGLHVATGRRHPPGRRLRSPRFKSRHCLKSALNPGSVDERSWAGEIALDTQWAHADAPGATIDLVISHSDSDADILAAQQYVVDHNLGDVLSQSFG